MGLKTVIMANMSPFDSTLECQGENGGVRFVADVSGAVVLESLDLIAGEGGVDLENACVSAYMENKSGQRVEDAWNFVGGRFTATKIAEELSRHWLGMTGDEVTNFDLLEQDIRAALETLL